MIPRLSNVKILVKIAVACLVPLLGLISFSVIQVWNAWAKAGAARDVLAMTELAEAASLAVHEMQKERGLSVGYLSAKGARFAAELPVQRRETDRRVRGFRDGIAEASDAARSGPLGMRIAAADAEMRKLEALRQSVSAQAIAPAEAGETYTRTIAVVLASVDGIGLLSRDSDIVRVVGLYTAVVHGKELAGQERAAGARGFGAGRFDAEALRAFVALAAAQDQAFDAIRRTGSPAQQQALTAARESAAGAEVVRMRRVAVAAATGESGDQVDAASWFRAATGRIDALKVVEDRLAADLRQVAGRVADDAGDMLRLLVAVSVVLVSVASFAAFISARSITRPISALVGTMLTLADGRTDVDLSGAERKDEIGGMTRAVAVFRDNAVARQRLEENARAEQAARERRQQRIDELIAAFRSAATGILAAVGRNASRMDGTAKTLSGIATEATSQAHGAAEASEEASSNVQNVASASEELASSIQEIGRQIGQASEVVGRVSHMAESSNTEIAGLADAAQKIGDVVGLIQAIAAQTNLLALNATIEAARAGEAGRGFAVVASEVKTLAAQTAKATEEIAQQVAGIQASTGEVVEAIRAIVGTMHDVDRSTQAIAAAVDQQSSATGEISRNVQMAARGTEELAHNVTGVTAAIGETSRAADDMLAVSDELGQEAQALTQTIDRFLADVAAA